MICLYSRPPYCTTGPIPRWFLPLKCPEVCINTWSHKGANRVSDWIATWAYHPCRQLTICSFDTGPAFYEVCFKQFSGSWNDHENIWSRHYLLDLSMSPVTLWPPPIEERLYHNCKVDWKLTWIGEAPPNRFPSYYQLPCFDFILSHIRSFEHEESSSLFFLQFYRGTSWCPYLRPQNMKILHQDMPFACIYANFIPWGHSSNALPEVTTFLTYRSYPSPCIIYHPPWVLRINCHSGNPQKFAHQFPRWEPSEIRAKRIWRIQSGVQLIKDITWNWQSLCVFQADGHTRMTHIPS